MKKKKAWTTLAHECVDEYNDTIHSSTKYAPSYLMFGKKPTISPLQDDEQLTLEEDRRIGFQNSNKSFQTNKNRVDKNRREHNFRTGDKVYIENGNRMNRNKLHSVRKGPFTIVRQISNSFYEVACGKKKKSFNYFHSSKLVPFTSHEVTSGGEV
uniref:Uncharacterized protein n=1 Tax=Clastoptera arizonana TaxID=38151 RepID=A0A1B6D1A8_9HEMI